MKKIMLIACLLASNFLFAQTSNLPKTIKVFIDCSNGGQCFQEFIRQEIPIVDFVRDRLDADVHVIVTTQYNSSGAVQYSLNFVGRNACAKFQDTIQYSVPPSAIDDESRNLFVSKLKIGLVPFLNRTCQMDNINITYNKPNEEEKEKTIGSKDPWNYWVFQLGANGYLNGNQNYFEGSAYFNISADKETEQTKTNIYLSNSEQVQKFNDGTQTYRYDFQDYNAGVEHYKKINKHLGLGGGINAANSLFSNYKFQVGGTANIEYSIFPYKDFNTKRWVFIYNIGPFFNQYYDTTLYLKTKELQFQQTLGSIFSYIQPWGSTHVGVFWSNFLTDFNKNNLSLNGALQFKIAKGLNFAIWGNYTFVRNQINIRKGDIDINQLLVKNQELLSSYDFNLGVGIKYRFGSKFNTAVNPSFRGLNYSINL